MAALARIEASFCPLMVAVVALAGSAPAAAVGTAPEPHGMRVFLRYSGPPQMRFFGVAIGPDQCMYVAGGDLAAPGVRGFASKVSAAGREVRFAAFKSVFVGPGIDVDRCGNLYLAAGDRILRVGACGRADVIASGFSGAFDLRLAESGYIYVADHVEGRIYRVAPSGARSTCVDYGLSPGSFTVGGLAFDHGQGHLFSYEAAKRLLWRYTISAGGSLGRGEVACADAPPIYAFDVDAGGNVVGADYDKGEIVRVEPGGRVTYLTRHCGLVQPIGFRLGSVGFHPNSAFVADAEGVKEIALPRD